ncbi:MAG: hypothetical protein Q4D14_06900, partial [Bacteroidales bacterium]|nr:hypothetical protein [Bacteroidales bacterium]
MYEEAKKVIDDAETKEEKSRLRKLYDGIKKSIDKFWSWVGEHVFKIKSFGSPEEVADRVLYDLLNDTDLGAKGDAEGDVSFSSKPTYDENESIGEYAKKVSEWNEGGEPYTTVENSGVSKEAFDLVTKAVRSLFDGTPIEVVDTTQEEGRRILEEISRQKKELLNIAELSQKTAIATVMSSNSGAKVLKNIDNAIEEYEKKTNNRTKTFIGDLSRALGLTKTGRSQYGTFETMNGQTVTIRVSDHNATVSNFDKVGETEGISIVISRKPDNGVINDGKAHIVEFFYSDIKLNRAEGKPLVSILKSAKQALYSGEYKDTTGLIEKPREVNGAAAEMMFVGEEGVYNSMGFEDKLGDDGFNTSQAYKDLKVAKRMALENIAPKKIKIATGWEQGADGKWRYELPDIEFADGTYSTDGNYHGAIPMRLNSILTPVWMERIRSMYNLGWSFPQVSFYELFAPGVPESEKKDKIIGLYNRDRGGSITINLGSDFIKDGRVDINNERVKSVLIHEIQHYLQYKEGFSRGTIGRDHKRSAGEVEARNVQHRIGMTQEERRNSLASETEDVPRSEQIVEFLTTPDGTVFGWVEGNKIYLTPEGMNPNTPIHEYTHLWCRAVERKNGELWENVKSLIKDTPWWDEVMKDDGYADIRDDENRVASEVLSRLSGRKNAERFAKEAQKMLDEANGEAEKGRLQKLIDRVKEAVTKFWDWVGKDLFKLKKFGSIDEITDRVLYDLVDGTDLGAKGDVEGDVSLSSKPTYDENESIGEYAKKV